MYHQRGNSRVWFVDDGKLFCGEIISKFALLYLVKDDCFNHLHVVKKVYGTEIKAIESHLDISTRISNFRDFDGYVLTQVLTDGKANRLRKFTNLKTKIHYKPQTTILNVRPIHA